MNQKNSPPRFVFLLNVGLRAIERWLDSRTDRPATLSSAQAGALFFLHKHDGALIGDIAQALSVGASAMTGMANRMEQAGLITRVRDTTDGRAIRLHLTEEGQVARRRAQADLKLLNAKLTEGFTEAEMHVVARWLEKLPDQFQPDSKEND
jgi:MarR family transcriptional regulator, organic hydroperoxide resistance regulator